MITKKIIAEELAKFKLNYMLNIEDKTMELYTKYLLEDLNTEGFTDDEFKTAIRTIKRNNPNMYGKMPNLAMFIEARPPKPFIPSIAIKQEQPKQIKNPLTPKEQKARDDRIVENLRKMNVVNENTRREKEEENRKMNKWMDDLKKRASLNPMSPTLKKLQEEYKK